MVLLVLSFVMTIVAGFSPSRRHWVLAAARLRYLLFGLMFGAFGLWITFGAVSRWPDWGSLILGLFMIAMGAVWLYARGGIGPDFPGA
ncbi:MAG TPA: hypothetical protein VFH90_08700 [Candidatus Limnocylindria bacterium]|nr:hypothetical protein [Candidatus Limnocylindria bacterium]